VLQNRPPSGNPGFKCCATAAVTFLVLLVTAGIRATPGVLMVPLEGKFGWSNDQSIV
jgi:hypothetical protein